MNAPNKWRDYLLIAVLLLTAIALAYLVLLKFRIFASF